MTTNSENVLVALTGAVGVGPLGTTMPTDTAASWNAAIIDLGYLSEDGVTETPEDETTEIPAWQNGDIVRSLITRSSIRFGFTMIETTKAGVELHHGGDVTGWHASGRGPASIAIAGTPTDRFAFLFDMVDGDDDVRIAVPNGSIVERGEIVYKNDEPVGYPVVIQANPGPGGIRAIKYFSNLAGLPTVDPEA